MVAFFVCSIFNSLNSCFEFGNSHHFELRNLKLYQSVIFNIKFIKIFFYENFCYLFELINQKTSIMSQIFEIHTSGEFVKEDLFHAINYDIPNLKGVRKSEEMLYFYADGTSIRGIDFWKTENGFELQLNGMSSLDDYRIVGSILKYFRTIYKYKIIKDLSYAVDGEPNSFEEMWFWKAENNYNFEQDAQNVKLMSEATQSIVTIYGPKQAIHIGPYTLKMVGAGKDGWEKRLKAHILKLLYKLPENEDNNIMALKKSEDEEIILKLIASNTNYILDKYDYLCVANGTENLDFQNMIVFTNDILNENLPQNWERVDDYTIIAKALNTEEYFELYNRLKAFDCKNNILN